MTLTTPVSARDFPSPVASELAFPDVTADSGRVKHGDFLALLRRRWLHAVVIAMATAISDLLSLWAIMVEVDKDIHHAVLWFLLTVINMFSLCMAVLILLTVVQVHMPATRWRLPVMLAAAVALPAGMTSLWSFDQWAIALGADWVRAVAGADEASFKLYVYWEFVAFGVLFALLYEWQARTERVIEAMRRAHIASEGAERSILESRLSSLKARVDPELLFAVVARANALYGENIAAGEKLLEQLIEFLRASLPQARATTVTLEQEMLLCRRYLDLEKSMRADAFSFETRVDPALASSFFPPAVLLPLLQAILAAASAATWQRHLSITADREPAGARIDITCHATAPPPPRETLDAAWAMLRSFFGDEISVVATDAPFGGRLVRIEVPHVST